MKPTAAICTLVATIIYMASLAQADDVIINAVGDIMLAGRWSATIRKNGYDSPFLTVARELKSGDITIANLESPIALGGSEYTDKKFRFRAEPEVAGALKNSGINLVTLANNHSMDFGVQALAETILRLRLSDVKREAELLPLDILHRRDGFQPQPVSGVQATVIIEHLNMLSSPLNTHIEIRDGRYIVTF